MWNVKTYFLLNSPQDEGGGGAEGRGRLHGRQELLRTVSRPVRGPVRDGYIQYRT